MPGAADPVGRWIRRRALIGAAAGGLSLLAGPVQAPARPGPAPARPFSFLRHYTDQLGVPGYDGGTAVTAQSDLYTGFAELSVRVGTTPRAFSSDGRTLERNRYPVLHARAGERGIVYRLTVFAAPVGDTQVNFARVEASNAGRAPATARVTAYIRHAGAPVVQRPGALTHRSYRFDRPASGGRPGLYFQPGVEFNPGSTFEFHDRTLLRDGGVLYDFPVPPTGVRLARELRADSRPVREDTIFGTTVYSSRLRPGARFSLDYRMPVTPVDPAGPSYAQISTASFDAYRGATRRAWDGLLGPAMRVRLPEPKVADTFYASLVNILMARYRRNGAGDWIQAVNLQRYHAFYLRDAAALTYALDLSGLHTQAEENLPFFLTWQEADGLFSSHPGQFDGFGEALWAFGQHLRYGGDLAAARRAYPAVQRAMAWFIANRAADPLHLMPRGDPGDNELIAGHLSGDNFWADAGIAEAVEMARRLGENGDAARWSAELADFRTALQARVRALVARVGYIPPALDAEGGQDWGNYWAAYPGQSFPPFDPAVTATIRHARRAWREGIATYGQPKLLHAYLGFRLLETQLLRAEQGAVVRGLYAALAHTTSTDASFETGPRPFGNRAVDTATVPHGWWAAEYVTLLRNMLVREDGQGVVLASALAPSWLRPGRVVSVTDAPTQFGPVSFTLRATRGGARLSWRAGLSGGAGLAWAVPSSVEDLRGARVANGRIELAGQTGTLAVSWRLSRRPQPSFESTAASLRRSYRQARAW